MLSVNCLSKLIDHTADSVKPLKDLPTTASLIQPAVQNWDFQSLFSLNQQIFDLMFDEFIDQ